MSLLGAQAAELDYTDAHPDDPANWATRRTYVTSTQRGGGYGRTSHIAVRRLDYLPDAWLPACSRVIRGTVSATPPLRICRRCERMVGDA